MGTAITTITHAPIFVKFGLLGLFVNSVLSPFVPIPTEIAVSALILSEQSLALILTVLITGSIIGSFFGYFVGYSGNKVFLRLHKGTHVKTQENEHRLVSRYSWLAILFSPWMPFIGNAIVIGAGAKKYNFKTFSFSIIAGEVIKATATVYLISVILPHLLKGSLS